ncbi:MAG: hypothetical protein V1926_02410 [Candidatus Peregrinibacteria bacterium]
MPQLSQDTLRNPAALQEAFSRPNIDPALAPAWVLKYDQCQNGVLSPYIFLRSYDQRGQRIDVGTKFPENRMSPEQVAATVQELHAINAVLQPALRDTPDPDPKKTFEGRMRILLSLPPHLRADLETYEQAEAQMENIEYRM